MSQDLNKNKIQMFGPTAIPFKQIRGFKDFKNNYKELDANRIIISLTDGHDDISEFILSKNPKNLTVGVRYKDTSALVQEIGFDSSTSLLKYLMSQGLSFVDGKVVYTKLEDLDEF